MPYAKNADLPVDQTDQYSPAAKTRFRKTFNAVHAHSGNEAKAFAVAHAAAKKHTKEERRSRLARSAGYDGRSK